VFKSKHVLWSPLGNRWGASPQVHENRGLRTTSAEAGEELLAAGGEEGFWNMLHFTCDLCGRSIDQERYITRIEVAPAFDPDQVTEEDLDADHLEEIAESLAELESTGDFELEDFGPKKFRFDLCPHCWKRYLKDPLGRDSLRRLNFSQN
jgi:hypothetical protein